jgi:hypothetical protein
MVRRWAAASVAGSLVIALSSGFAAQVPAASAAGLPKNVKRVCAWPPAKGKAACLVLMRTDVKAGRVDTSAGYGPPDLHQAYKLPALDSSDGEGQTVAVVDAFNDPNAESDLAIYRSRYGLPACTTADGCFRKVNEFGQSSQYPSADSQWAVEESLDVDMVSAICPKCHILLVEASNENLLSLGHAVDTAVALDARYISNSYGFLNLPPNNDPAVERSFNHPGVAITAASGDSGYQASSGILGPGEDLPAAFPQVIAVGGTSLLPASNSRGWNEIVWPFSGSGCAKGLGGSYPKPPWQTDKGCGMARTANDVAAVADPETGVAVYDSYHEPGWSQVGGTSASSPIIASVYALAGPPDPGTYPGSYLYRSQSGLFDIVAGTNFLSSKNCSPAYLCNGQKGYDAPSGQGTPDGIGAFGAPQPQGYVALGDSYSAGEGNRPYEPGTDTKTNTCHRSESAYPTMIKWPGHSKPIAVEAKAGEAYSFSFRACGGAKTTTVTNAAAFPNNDAVEKWIEDGNVDWAEAPLNELPEGLQAETPTLNFDTRLVTISIGGNDARFADILFGCLVRSRTKLKSCSGGKYKLKRNSNGKMDPKVLTKFEPLVIAALQSHLVSTYMDIHNRARNAEIIVAGYPPLFPPKPAKACATLSPSTQVWLNGTGQQLKEVTAAAVAQARAAGLDIRFVDPTHAFVGHSLCTKKPWLYGITFQKGRAIVDPGSFHPRQPGQDAYAKLINECLADPSTCVG